MAAFNKVCKVILNAWLAIMKSACGVIRLKYVPVGIITTLTIAAVLVAAVAAHENDSKFKYLFYMLFVLSVILAEKGFSLCGWSWTIAI